MSMKKQVTEGEEPVSPFAQLFSLPGLDVFNIVTIGWKTEGDPFIIVEGLKNTLINHPRFSSILVTDHDERKGKAKWIPTKTMNDVLLGMVQAGLSRYLNQIYDLETTSKTRKTLDKTCLHGVVFFNLRPNRDIEDLANMMAKGSKCRWGNSIGYVLIPLWMKSENDILEYLRQAKTTMDRKKLSLEPQFSYVLLKLTMEVFGLTALKNLVERIFGKTTMIFSNVVGPAEEISFFGHQISYIAASAFGIPQAVIISIQSYMDKLVINLSVDLDVIPDPHHLCNLIIEALSMMNSSASEKIVHASEV
ncbi:wax ester synthase/diacylglycerol acyltransferase 2 isoform X2 [Raphanus sativus]|uniref:Wax ester synthase/diacylglycerol acyltransferase 2 isoform X2 n=1 Tax=Raphanus sativus TaxID=3726 RepID=A0A9W3C440_RAPSA|nr:wax ester synthase/diacylglycerol acyltransferase 2 isoform X2 [Raphanus sativus]